MLQCNMLQGVTLVMTSSCTFTWPPDSTLVTAQQRKGQECQHALEGWRG